MLRSLKRLFKRHPWRRPVVALYGQIVGQARLPVFYTRFGVPDTVDAYFGRSVAYDLALRPDADPTDLTEGLRRNLYRKTDDSVSESQVLAVAAYVRASHDHLATLSPAHIITGSGLFAAIPEEEG